MGTLSLKRYYIKCLKCGYEWMSKSPNPARCALCNNPNPDKPKTRQVVKDAGTDS